MAGRVSTLSVSTLLGQQPALRTSRRSQPPRASFSVDNVVQDRYRKMIRFKRVLASHFLLGEGGMDLTNRDAVDELVQQFEVSEQSAQRASLIGRASRVSLLSNASPAAPEKPKEKPTLVSQTSRDSLV
ncbi:unnamed protein product [Polarella glacialis]|uniref:Uncharacterized protein n=1 Tax=Polarella glacialis TaxID=89957 RepID=A0A813LEJ8_POLGL|nr:unnamed protein product [Polarella glacialis]|mmetsp:Transcript_62762/g.101678  ORF Transcript_62762/g.101678 Transcript_62762/m.101678 type:complete len:129 (-) Transcript_62762:97-483(-)